MRTAQATMHITDAQFDAVALEISSTLGCLGVPKPEHDEFMQIIERYLPQVVGTAA